MSTLELELVKSKTTFYRYVYLTRSLTRLVGSRSGQVNICGSSGKESPPYIECFSPLFLATFIGGGGATPGDQTGAPKMNVDLT